MSLNALLDLQLDPFDKATVDEILDEGFFTSNASSLAATSNQNVALSMEHDGSTDCELLLTDYLLNFGDESTRDVFGDEHSSGVECCSDNEGKSLASLKKSLRKTKKDSSEKGKVAKSSEKNSKRGKGGEPDVKAKKVATFKDGSKSMDVRKEKERLRSVRYRCNRTQKIKTLETETLELKESNKTLSEKNLALNERVSALEGQVEYLEGVIANESSLSAILSTLAAHSGLQFQGNSRMNSLKRKRQDDDEIQDENTPVNKKSDSYVLPKSAGVCLHLAPGRVSLEFCKECHKHATTGDA